MMARLSGNVYLCSYFPDLEHNKDGGSFPLLEGSGRKDPVVELSRAAAGVGHCNALPDPDGGTRRLPLLIRDGKGLYPAAPFQAALDILGLELEDVSYSATGAIEISRENEPPLVIPCDSSGQTLVNFLGGLEAFPSFSFRQVLQDDRYPESAVFDLSVFKDKIVLVGATFAGNTDLRPTPFSPSYPMVAVQATLLNSILTGDFIHTPPRVPFFAAWILMGILMGLLAHGFRPLVSLAVCFLAGGTYLGGAIAAFSLWSWYVELVGPFSTIIFAYVFVTTAKHFTEERKAREVRAMFSRYVTERVVNELISNPGLAKLGGTRRETTVLFADIRDFTRFSEKHSAEEVVSMLNEYLAEMTDIVFRWEGTLDKFIGDAIVAFWGAPLAQENHAELALRCSLNMIRKMEEMTDRWTIEGREALQIGIGLNTGEVIVGNIGAENKKMDYTVIGDHVNLGARVEALNKKYGSHILITEFTLESVRDLVASGRFGHLAIQGMDRVVVKGKENPVQVFQLVPREPGCETTLTECPETIVYQKEK
jgi:adenylate cyclase